MLERYLLVWLVLSSLAAYCWPVVQRRWPSQLPPLADVFTASEPLLPWLIAATMFAIGLMLPRDEVRQVARRWPTVLGGTALQYTTMPLLAYGMGILWQLEGQYLIGMILVGCVPGAMASNVLTLLARGNTSYSVSLTTMATLLSPLAVPMVLALSLSSDKSVSIRLLLDASFLLLLTVVLPVVSGYVFSRWFPQWQTHYKRIGPIVANLAILWIIAVVVGRSREQFAQYRFDLLGALLAVNIGGYLAGYFGGWTMRLDEPMRRALTLEIGMQNAGLGAMLATQLFPGPDQKAIAIAPAMYTFGCMLTGTMLAQAWALYSSRRGGGKDD